MTYVINLLVNQRKVHEKTSVEVLILIPKIHLETHQ